MQRHGSSPRSRVGPCLNGCVPMSIIRSAVARATIPKTMTSIAFAWVPKGTFHHIGFVVSSIHDSVQDFAQSIDALWDGEIIYDPNQHVRVTFLHTQNEADPLFELVEPAGERSPVLSFAQKGGGLHHVCHVVTALEATLAQCTSRGMIIVRPPLPAAAFGGRRIAWAYTRNRLLIEYLEEGSRRT